MGICGEHVHCIFDQIAKLLYHPKQNLGGRGARTPAAKSLYWSIFKKCRHLGFGVLMDIWFMALSQETKSLLLLVYVESPLICSVVYMTATSFPLTHTQ